MKLIPILGFSVLITLSSRAAPFATGKNSNGQLGTGGTSSIKTPAATNIGGALAGKLVTKISTGSTHTLALTADGLVYAWGRNNYGQLGDGTETQRTNPVAVNMTGVLAGKTVKAISAGIDHSLVLTTDGLVFGWGWNGEGQLGDGTSTNRMDPVAVSITGVLAGKTVTALSSRADHALVLTSDNRIFGWGFNSTGQLGDGSTANRTAPVAVSIGALAGKTISAIEAGGGQSLALSSDGRVYAWGSNANGEVGDGSTEAQRTAPVAVKMDGVLNGKTVTGIGAGNFHSLALTSEGKVYSWGDNTYGQLGDDTNTAKNAPIAVLMTGPIAGKTISFIAGGSNHSMALSTEGKAYAWGYNGDGQLGDGSGIWRYKPVAVFNSGNLAGTIVNYIDGGFSHSMALATVDDGLGEIAVEQPAGSALQDGASTVNFGKRLTGTDASLTFTVKNAAVHPLANVAVTFDGAAAADFSVTTAPLSPVPAGTSTTFVVKFTPSAAGTRTATLRLASNDGDENPFDIAVTGSAYAPGDDEDGDGMLNGQEVNLVSLGFDPEVDNTELITLLRDNGLYRASDMQTLALGAPVLERDPFSGNFLLRLKVEKSPALDNWTTLTGFTVEVDQLTGDIDLTIPSSGETAHFFRVLGKKP